MLLNSEEFISEAGAARLLGISQCVMNSYRKKGIITPVL
jgi:hypothetical protein